ncbi:MAG: single-stranded DNA-binding protein [Actinomycetia bacterium]|nr:single-stranded DNA-binding protein [Actinomycetes bacterium]
MPTAHQGNLARAGEADDAGASGDREARLEATVARETKAQQRPGVEGDASPPVNLVQLCGRLAAAPIEQVLPSGDELVTFRLVVPRPTSRWRGKAGGRAVSVDTIDCSVWNAALRRKVVRWVPGEQIFVDGCLRRRFWRGPGGARSRYDVEVLKASRLRRTP